MKKVFYFLIVAGFATTLLQGCGKDPVEQPVAASVNTTEISGITEDGFTAGGVINAGTATITEAGVCWDINPNPTVDKNKMVSDQKSGTFSVTVTGLKSGTNYFVRAYVISADGTVYGDQRSATTDGQLALALPFVERFRGTQFPPQYWQTIDHNGDGFNWYAYSNRFFGAMSDTEDDDGNYLNPYNFLISPKIAISGTNPKLEWNVGASSINYPAEHYKVLVSTAKFTAQNCTSNGDKVFEETLTSVDGRTLNNRSVDLKAYVGKEVYIAWVHFDTEDEYALLVADIRIGSQENPATVTAPVMGVLTIGDVSSTSAAVAAIITSDGGVSVTGRGFCYGKSANPTIDNATVVDVAASAATALTSFSTELTLEQGTTYHVRAYAKNAAGITYSSDQTVNTPAATVLLSEDFATDPFDRGWTEIDKDGDGYTWEWYDGAMTSDSWRSKGVGALTPENYLISPSFAIPAAAKNVTLRFQLAAEDDTDYEEAYKVIVSENEITFDNCRDADVLQDWTTLTEEYSDETFVGVSVDMTAYKGKTVYIGIVHGNCTGQYYILLRALSVIAL